MELTMEQFKTKLSTTLRDLAVGTTADLTDSAVAFWDGNHVVYAFIRDGDAGEVFEEFDLDNDVWEKWHDWFAEWAASPMFSVRPEVGQRLSDSTARKADH